MYAHQVIEDFLNNAPLFNVNLARFMKDQIIPQLKISQKFHLDDIVDAINIRKEMEKKKRYLFMGEDLRLPFSNCWFDYPYPTKKSDLNPSYGRISSSSKRGILALELFPNLMTIYFCFYLDAFKTWALRDQAYLVAINSTISDHIEEIIQYWKKPQQVLIKEMETLRQVLTTQQGQIMPMPLINIAKDVVARMAEEDQGDFSILNIILLLLNCKNIETENNHPPLILNKSRRKKGKQELFTYKTLKLRLPKSLEGKSDLNIIGNHNRIHFCMGHFKHRKTGVFWWQPHVRGQNKDGIVVKDYEIKILKA